MYILWLMIHVHTWGRWSAGICTKWGRVLLYGGIWDPIHPATSVWSSTMRTHAYFKAEKELHMHIQDFNHTYTCIYGLVYCTCTCMYRYKVVTHYSIWLHLHPTSDDMTRRRFSRYPNSEHKNTCTRSWTWNETYWCDGVQITVIDHVHHRER